MRFTAECARKARQKYLERNRKGIEKIVKRIYEKVETNANKGMDRLIFNTVEINCPICHEQAVIEQLKTDGYEVTYNLGEYTLKW